MDTASSISKSNCYIKSIEARPKKERNPNTSVIVVSITPEATQEAKDASSEGTDGKPQCKGCTPAYTGVYDTQQKFDFIVTAINNNIIRISGGALGFPVL